MKRKLGSLGIIAVFIAGLVATRGIEATSAGPQIRPSISFEGLAALVRSEAFDRGVVVLVDPTRATLQPNLPAHHAMLAVPMSAVKSGTPDSFTDATKTIGVWELANVRVELRTSATGPLRPVRTAPSVTHPRTPEEWRDVKWIVDMKALAGSSEIRSTLMTATDLRGSALSARVALGAGTIEATRPPEPFSQSEVRFLVLRGLTPARPVQQAVTQKLLYTPDAAESLAIVLHPSDRSAPRTIELKASADEIPISVSNHTTMNTLVNGEMPQQGVHSLAFYDLLATPAKTPVIPSALVPYPETRTLASPGFFCDGNWYLFTSSSGKDSSVP